MRKKDFLITGFLVVLSLFLLKDLYKPGFYTSHDGPNQMVRLFHFTQALADGQFPPRWGGNLLHGYGYPLFIFSYHLPWWIAQVPLFFGTTIFASIKFVYIVTYMFSGLAMFFYLKNTWGRLAATVASIIYLVTPFRFVDIFVRSALGESVSFAFIPLVFWSLEALRVRYRFSAMFIGALSVAALFLSHVMVFSLFFMPLASIFLVNLFLSEYRMRYFLRVLAMGAIGIGLAAYYVLPALYYRPMTIFASKFSGAYAYNFTPLSKLLYSPWGYNGIDLPDEMSRQVGLNHWFVLALASVVIVWLILKGKKKERASIQLRFGIVYILSFVFVVFMMVKESHFLWKMIQSLALVEFPWRHLVVTTFLGSSLSAFLVASMQNKYAKWALVCILLGVTFYTNRNYLRINKVDDTPVTSWVDSEGTTSLLNEYLPTWVDLTNIKNRKFFIESDARISQIKQTSNAINFQYESPKMSKVLVHHMYFPGWKAEIDEKELTIGKTASGSMELYVPAGSQKVSMYFGETAVMKLGNLISLSTTFILFVLFLFQRKNKIKPIKGKKEKTPHKKR